MREGKKVGRKEGRRGSDLLAFSPSHLPTILLGLCLGILALRVTYTESPTAQMLTMPVGLTDTIYSLTLSGLLIFAFVFWLLGGLFTGRLTYRFTGIEIGLAVFLAAALVSTGVAAEKRAAITQTVTLLAPICTALLLAQILDGPVKVRLVLIVLVALGIVCTFQCAEQFFLSNAITIEQYEKNPQMLLEPLGIEAGTFPHFLFEHRLYSRGVRGFFTTSNSAASFAILSCAAAVILVLWRLREVRSREVAPRYGVFTAVAAVLIAGGLFLTQSKGGILAFWAGLVLCGLFLGIRRWFPERKRLFLAVFAGIALLFLVGAGYAMVRYGLKHGRLPGGNSMLVRWQYWAASAQMLADHPWTGVGPGNFSNHYPHYKPAAALESVADPHNFPLSLLTQYGPLGLLGFLAMVLVPLWRLAAARPPALPAPEARRPWSFRKPALALLLTICASLLLVRRLLIPATADGPDVLLYEMITMHVAPVAAFLIGFLLVASPLDEGRRPPIESVDPLLPIVLGSAVLAVLVHNLIDFALFEPGVWMTFWIALACLIAPQVQQRTGFRLAAAGSRGRKPLALGLAVALFAAYGLYVWRPAYNVTIGLQQAQRAASAGNYDLAYRRLEAAAQADSLSPVAANFRGRLHLQQYEQAQHKQSAALEEAARCFREAIARSSAEYKNYEKLGLVYDRLGQPQEAYEWYLKAAELYPGCERLWFELARISEQLGRPNDALRHYTKAVEIEDGFGRQFRQMYPEREHVVSRLGDRQYQHARKRIEELTK